jgi:hypothetical protein
MMRSDMMMAEAAPAGFAESELFEYHLYTLGRRTDIPDNSAKQLELFPAATGVACRRELVFTAGQRPHFYGSPMTDQGFAGTQNGEVGAWLQFENRETNGLGLALPAGRVRVNQQNASDGAMEFIGEDVIRHTPRNETLRLRLGSAFDIVGERRQMNFSYDEKARTVEERFEITVRNRKKTPADVVVREYLHRWTGWQISNNSTDFEKRDAQTVDFPVRIAADGEAVVRYTVRYSW